MKDRIVIIDGNSLLNRAYHAIRNPMITKDGVYTQGVYGFLNMLEKIKREYSSGYIVVAFDMKTPTFRHEEFKEYKAGRKPAPEELKAQFPLLKEVLDAMKIKILEVERFEADDIMGTVSRIAEENSLKPLLITGDRDAFQLASNITKIMYIKKGISQVEIYDQDKMLEEYGLSPAQFIDYKGLMGDKSDNIPGINGIGDKGARELLAKYGSMENIFDHVDELTGSKKKNIQEGQVTGLMSKKLATIQRHMNIDIDFEDYKWQEPDYDKLMSLYRKLEFSSFLKKLKVKAENQQKGGNNIADESQNREAEQGLSKNPQEVVDIYRQAKGDVNLIKNHQEWQVLSKELKEDTSVVIRVFGDNNHKDVPRLQGMAIMIASNYHYVDFVECPSLVSEVIKTIAQANIKIIGHNLKEDLYHLMCYGLSTAQVAFDTAIAQYIIESRRNTYELADLVFEMLGGNMPREDEEINGEGQLSLFDNKSAKYANYGQAWCNAVSQVMEVQKTKIIDEELEQVLYQVELPLVPVMAHMERVGFRVDKNILDDFGREIAIKLDLLTESIHKLAGQEFNIKSPAQLGKVLFEDLELPTSKKTKTGYSTGAEALEAIEDLHPIVPLVLDYRKLSKLLGTYVEGLLPLIHQDGKIHAKFNQTITTTGRISSSDPNLQNIPIRQEEGRLIRKAFVPNSEEYFLIGADYSQIELRILAHLSQDPLLIEAFKNGEDIHRSTAARVLGIKEEDISLEQRSRAKAVNFGVIYGMSGFGLSTELNITRKEADQYIKSYFETHQKVKTYMDEQVATCKEKGYVRTLMGRKRMIHEINSSNYMLRQSGERLAMNTPIQGSAADVIKIAMVKTHKALEKYKSSLILQVHDELIIHTHRQEEEEVKTLLIRCMEEAVLLSVDLIVDLHKGENWYELK